MTEFGQWELGYSIYQVERPDADLYHRLSAKNIQRLHLPGNPVYFRENILKDLGTPVRTCKLRGLQWKLILNFGSRNHFKSVQTNYHGSPKILK